MATNTFYINKEFVDESRALIPANDLIVLRGYGVFDFLVTYNRRPFHLEAHLERLEHSAGKIGIPLNHARDELARIVHQTLEKNPHHPESAIRLVCSGGISSDGVTPEGNGILMVMATPRPVMPEIWYTKGGKIITVDIERFLPGAKSTNYLSAVFAQQAARDQGAVEAVYRDRHNRLLEGTTSNIFCIRGNVLTTPPDSILPGVTRQVALTLAADHFDIRETHITMDDLSQMEEVFITSSNKEIMPVAQVDGQVIGTGRPGEKTKKLMALWHDYTLAYGKGEIH